LACERGAVTTGFARQKADAPKERAHRNDPAVLAAIALGGALGAPARYGVAQLIAVSADDFPWATFLINVSGSFALALFFAFVVERYPPTRYLRPFVATGFLGAYTTYSTFAVETDVLVKDGHVALALAYVTATLVLGVVATWAGLFVGRRTTESGSVATL
jgi:CrcB protein